MIGYKLACGHAIKTSIELTQQYPSDQHFIWCPSCRNSNNIRIPLDWQEVVGILYTMQDGIPQVLPSEIMRLQPKVPRSRIRPFPYVRGRDGTKGRGRGRGRRPEGSVHIQDSGS